MHRCRRNQRRLIPLGRVCREPEYWADGGRRIEGVKRIQAFAWNCRNQTLDAKGEAQATTIARRDTEAKAWGGATRSSVEGSVMELERRGRVKTVVFTNQLETG
jgi:hypothetical protein